MSFPVPGLPGPKRRRRRVSFLPAALRRSRIASTGSQWTWPDEAVLRGSEIALEPVTEENKLEWWNTWTSDVLDAMGIDHEAHDEAGRSVPLPGASLQLDGFAVVRALDNEGHLCKVVGGVGAMSVGDKTVELGLWLIPQHRGWGAGADALRIAVLHWCDLGYGVGIFTAAANEPMIAVAEKVGLERVGTVERTMPNGRIVNGVEFRSPA